MRLALVLAGLLSLAAPALAQAASQPADRIEIPITQTRFDNGAIRYAIKVGVDGSPPIDVMLDTGSVGLHLLPGAQPHAAPRGRATRATYGSGVELSGQAAATDLSLNGQVTIRADVDWTREVHCMEDRPHCPAEGVPLDKYRIGGTPGAGFQAILGIGMRRGAATNPLTRTATGIWIVVLPRPDDVAPGKLILNATAADRAQFPLLVKLQSQNTGDGDFWWDNTVPTCLGRADDKHPLCGPTMLDTGAPNLHVITDGPPGQRPWPTGTKATLAYGAVDSPAITQAFTVGKGPGTHVEFGRRAKSMPWTGLNAGLLPFLGLAVIYDMKDGYIGLAPRAAFAAP